MSSAAPTTAVRMTLYAACRRDASAVSRGEGLAGNLRPELPTASAGLDVVEQDDRAVARDDLASAEFEFREHRGIMEDGQLDVIS